jgi:hypothetical protein
MLRTAWSPPQQGFDAGLRPDPFPDPAASLLPGLLTATRTGLAPAGDDELMLEQLLDKHLQLWAHPVRWIPRKHIISRFEARGRCSTRPLANGSAADHVDRVGELGVIRAGFVGDRRGTAGAARGGRGAASTVATSSASCASAGILTAT